jgi:hypothetical protein
LGYFISGEDMRTVIQLMILVAVCACIYGCSSGRSKAEEKELLDNDKTLALKFLQGVQDGDKGKMFEAANLTKEIVDDSRDKVIHPAKYNQTEQQKKDSEHALRVSGNIDFIAAKIKVMLPKSASFQIAKATGIDIPAGGRKTEHSVQVTYSKKEEAITDKTNKPVKVMVLPLLQISRQVNGRWIYDISFDTKDFDKIADREFQVVSYF